MADRVGVGETVFVAVGVLVKVGVKVLVVVGLAEGVVVRVGVRVVVEVCNEVGVIEGWRVEVDTEGVDFRWESEHAIPKITNIMNGKAEIKRERDKRFIVKLSNGMWATLKPDSRN